MSKCIYCEKEPSETQERLLNVIDTKDGMQELFKCGLTLCNQHWNKFNEILEKLKNDSKWQHFFKTFLGDLSIDEKTLSHNTELILFQLINQELINLN